MLIKTLRMKNFRQFKGNTELNFSDDANKNVTVILGDNTFGKTTLMQAFNWCLYGKANLPNNKRLLNHEVAFQMQDGDKNEVEVEITLKHDNMQYIITRRQKYICSSGKVTGEKGSTVLMSRKELEGDGQTKPVDTTNLDDIRIKEIINTILPEGLSTYFFFDTERISTVSDRKDIRKAVNDFLGFSAIENAARHLGDRSKKNSVIGIFYSQMYFKGDKRAKEALDKIQSANDNRDAIAEQLQECANQIDHYEKIKAEIEQTLRAHQATAELQKEIDALERKIQNEEESRAKTIEKYFKKFNASALPFFIFPLLNVADRFLKAVKIDDKGVRDITKTSIMELIERGHCICGREICEGNEAYRHIMDAIKYLPPESIGTTVRLYRERLKDFSRLSERVYGDIKEIHDRIAQSTAWIHGWEYDIEYKRKKIAGQENMSQRESELADIRRRLRELNEKKDRLNKEDGALARDIDHYQKFYDSLTTRSDKNHEIQKYLDYAEELNIPTALEAGDSCKVWQFVLPLFAKAKPNSPHTVARRFPLTFNFLA